MNIDQRSLRKSASESLIWGLISTFGRDVIQFSSMLILVRLLSPEIFGQFALGQAIIGAIAVLSLKSIANFPLQTRDPSKFDWSTHFSAALVLNMFATISTIVLGVGIYTFADDDLKAIGLILPIMALVFPLEIIGTQHLTWLQSIHNWKRVRTLILLGSLAGAMTSVLLAQLGAGIMALIVGPIIFGLPFVIDCFIQRPFSIRYQKGWFAKYEEGRTFGINRVAAGALGSGTKLAEQSIISAFFGFSTLGIYSRSIGLVDITSGRIGPFVVQSLYPVLTRTQPSSQRFRKFAGVLFQGVTWTSIPIAAFLALESDLIVSLIYGDKWLEVIPLLIAATVFISIAALHRTMNQILLANLQQKTCLRIDTVAALSKLAVIFSVVFLGPRDYLLVLAGHATLIFVVSIYCAAKGKAISAQHVIEVVLSCTIATLMATAVTAVLPKVSIEQHYTWMVASLAAHGVVFSSVYISLLRLQAPSKIKTLVEAFPLPSYVKSVTFRLLLLNGAPNE